MFNIPSLRTSARFASATLSLAFCLLFANAGLSAPVVTSIPATPTGYRTVVYYLENADASKLVGTLSSVYGSGAAGTMGLSVPNQSVQVVADVGTNSLVVSAPAADLDSVLDTVKKLDIAPFQVMIEAVILEVTLDKSSNLGVDWTYHHSNVDFGIRSAHVAPPGGAPEALALTGFKQAIVSSHGLYGMIHALMTDNRTRILATPKLFAANNKEATILIGDQVPIRTGTTIAAGVTQNTFTYVDVGIKLVVTPHINRRRQTVMDVAQEIKTIRTLPTPIGVTVENPIITTRQSKTSVALGDNQTAILGGLIRTDRTKVESKVPILGDLPLIGSAFRSKSDAEVKTEVLIFLTAHVITSDSELQKMVAEIQAGSTVLEQRSKVLFSDTHSIGSGLKYIDKYVIK